MAGGAPPGLTRLAPARLALAVAAGLALAALPFLRYAHFGAGAHADHEPHHGGQLGMVGEHHVELVQRDGRFEVYVSDAWRRPLRPARGRLAPDRGAPLELSWSGGRLVAPAALGGRKVEVAIELDDGTTLAIGFDLE